MTVPRGGRCATAPNHGGHVIESTPDIPSPPAIASVQRESGKLIAGVSVDSDSLAGTGHFASFHAHRGGGSEPPNFSTLQIGNLISRSLEVIDLR